MVGLVGGCAEVGLALGGCCGMGEGWLVASGWALGDSDGVWRVLMGWVR